ncbi:protein Shroom2 isoform X3 [Oncorhynchus tshawytscha]|uniref:protein Shroom2 isoform X3 n=1 Tax=Oncorhynchus tshawytscha TaxID=74940 RepID=UPI001C3C4CBC|nr:protein Shroom2 isoform X3 [Oncorhynchus tshawytscha]
MLHIRNSKEIEIINNVSLTIEHARLDQSARLCSPVCGPKTRKLVTSASFSHPYRKTEWRNNTVLGQTPKIRCLIAGACPVQTFNTGFSPNSVFFSCSPQVEEGSKAATVSLQVGDEIVNINTVPISGSRQEAVCLVKSSHKTLALVVRRRNEPVSRPHSWHSSKFTEDHPEPTESHKEPPPAPPPVWQVKHEVSASTKDLSSCGDHDSNLRQLSSQFSSVGNMERVERPSHPFQPGCLSPSRYHRSAEPLSGGGGSGGKRESAFSCLSSTSPPPEPALALANTDTAATESSMFHKGVQTQTSEDGRPGEQRHSRYLQRPQGDGGSESPRTVPEEQPGSRYSSSGSGRSHIGPVWNVPERRRVAAPPSPPPPPLRSDSFAVTKVYPAYTEGPGAPPHGQMKAQERGVDRLADAPENSSYRGRGNHIPHDENGVDPRCSYNPPPCKKDFLHPNIAAGAPDYNHNQLSNPNKLSSVCNQDVRQSQSPFTSLPNHQRQYSDESTFYLQTRSAPHPPKPQSVGSYYHSLQELPTNCSNSRNHVRSSTTSLSTSTIDQNLDCGGHIRYYCITTKQPTQPETRVRQSKSEVWRSDMELATGSNDRGSTSSSHKTNKVKYPPNPQPAYTNSKERNGNFQPANVLLYGHTASNSLSSSGKPTTEENERRSEGQRPTEAQLRSSYSPSPPKDHKAAPLREDPWVSQENHKISSQKSPMLHSLAQESRSPMLHSLAQESVLHQALNHPATAPPSNGGGEANHALQEALTDNTATSKLARRSDRYATTLRNEIQLKRAQLQKSRSAATLTCPSETEEPEEEETDPGGWKSTSSTSSDGSFSTSYKDHLKEAQARVLQATSFRRRDLEPPGSGSEAPLTKPNSHIVSRIGGRKRFPLNKRVHSFSEPDKINKLGVEGEGEHPVGTARSFIDRRKFFEMAAKPSFCRPISTIHKSGQQSSSTTSGTLERGEGKARGRAHSGETEEGWRPGLANETSSDHHPDPLSPAGRQALLEQQRLGTFAEYQVTWNMQRKASDTKPQGRYHSVDNILDQGTEETPVCVHERSRSSPSQDFHTQKIPMPWRETVENPYLDHRRGSYTTRGQNESREQAAQLHHFPQPPQPSIPRLTDTEPHSSRDVATPTPLPLPSEHRYKRDSANPAHNLPALPPYPSNHTHSSVSEQPLPPPTPAPKPQNTGLIIMPHWPLLGLETSSTTSSSYGLSSQEFLPGPYTHQAEPSSSSSCSSHGPELDPAPNQACSLGSTQLPSPSPGTTAGLGTEEGAADSTLEPPPSPSSHSPFFSYQPASLTVPSSGGTSSPSPQFAPQRLTDQPPVSVSMQDEAQSRPENRTNSVMEMSSVGKKVPVKIVHAESTTERESHQYLQHSEKNRAPGVSEGPDFPPPLPTCLPSPEPQPYSLFRAYTPYTRHGPQSPPRDPTLTAAPEEALSLGQSQTNGPSGTSTMGPQQPQKSNSEEDVKREELARDIMDKDKSLVDILDQSKMKTTMDLMEGIFPQGEQILDGGHQRRKVSPKQGLPPRGMDDRREEEGMSAATGSLVTSSSYYSTSAPKAELLNKMKDMQEDELEELEQDSEDELDINLASKKQELIDSLGKKLQVLREARENLQEDLHDNNSLGDEVEAVVQKVCKPNELDKFRMFVGDLDKVVSLLLSLSGRLARVENALNSLEEDTTPEEKRTLSEKRKLLIRQHEDAKELKENLDRRERLVYSIMAAHLSHESLADYQHFVKMKSALIIEQRKLEDKIKLGEEQLKCLLDSLLLEQRLLF